MELEEAASFLHFPSVGDIYQRTTVLHPELAPGCDFNRLLGALVRIDAITKHGHAIAFTVLHPSQNEGEGLFILTELLNRDYFSPFVTDYISF